MSTIERSMVRAINSGRCFAVVGAGPSCEIGLPPWRTLAESAIKQLKKDIHRTEIDQCDKLLSQSNYPAIFSVVAKTIGLDSLVKFVNKALVTSHLNGQVYPFIARWPFSVYLTTNYDDYLNEFLTKESIPFITKHNSLSDFRLLRAESKGLIFKIHGDCSTKDDIVLTKEQYIEFQKADSRKYWREKIRSVLHMVNVVLIGYSASDPDFKDQLELAKEIASPDHPIFMFAADITLEDIRKYYLQYNIRIIPYKNSDGTHRELYRALKRYDPFIAKRGTTHLVQDPIDEEKSTIASSIFLFTRLNLSGGNLSCLKKSYEALIMACLGQYSDDTHVTLAELQIQIQAKLHTSHIDPKTLHEGINSLYQLGYIEITKDPSKYFLSLRGREAINSTLAEHKLRIEKFHKSCHLFLRKEYPDLKDKEYVEIIKHLENGLVRAFEKRGLEMAKATFISDTLDLSSATDILEVINQESTSIKNEQWRSPFTDLMLEILLQPTQEMKERLAELSQGYFSYHTLGLDPKCSDERLSIAKDKSWILDSSIILPLLAKHCINHEFAVDLISKMNNLGLRLCTTGCLFDEVIDHAVWAISTFKDSHAYSPDLLHAASGGPGYKQNLFIDGYMKWSVKQGSPSLHEYFRMCFGDDYKSRIGQCVEKNIQGFNIEIQDFSQWPDFQQDIWFERDEVEKSIKSIRNDRGTFRGDGQCRAEAEVLLLCENKKAAFLSQSGVLDSLNRQKSRITWKPESMYRFLSSFSAAPPDEDILCQSMIQDFFYSGFDIINSDTLKHFFSGPIHQSRLQLDEEKIRYEEALGKSEFNRLKEDFETTPDIQKPFYSMQFAFYVARKESERRMVAEERTRRAEESKALSDRERTEYERLKAKETMKQRKRKKNQRRAKSNTKKRNSK